MSPRSLDVDRLWYGRHPLAYLLVPLGWLFCLLVTLRRGLYSRGLLASSRLPVLVIVVGNISVGGTGKTPLVIWLARHLRAQGRRPGILTRGYGGTSPHWPRAVDGDSDPLRVGDEAVLLARRSGCPVMAGPDRVAAARALLRESGCDVLISDDGLQHYRLHRDMEIAVVDGRRGHGNGRCLPAGPLREPVSRLDRVDAVVTSQTGGAQEYGMSYQIEGLRRCLDDQPVALASLATGAVHGVAGIGHPRRFFDTLRGLGLELTEHAFADHHPFQASELAFDDDRPVIMTEKDAVKYRAFADERHYYLAIRAELSSDSLGQRVRNRLQEWEQERMSCKANETGEG